MDGQDGAPGADGISPTVELMKENGVTTMTVTDAAGTHSTEIMDGRDGTDGADGVSPVVQLARSDAEKKTTLTITDAEGVKTVDIPDGAPGPKGERGISGYPPKLSDTGTWMVWDTETGAYTDTGVKAFYGDNMPATGVEDTGKVLTVTEAGVPGWMAYGHWETVLDTVWEQDVIRPTAFDPETGICTCAEGELDHLELDTEYVFFPQCVVEGAAYNTIINDDIVKVTKISDTTFSINGTPPTTFAPTNVKFSRGTCLAITDIDAKKIRLTLDGQFVPTARKPYVPFFGAGSPYFAENTGYTAIRSAYHAYQQVTAEVVSPYRIVGKILCGFNAPSNVANFHFKNNSFCCPLVPHDVPEGYERTYCLDSDGTKIAKLYSTSVPWLFGTANGGASVINDKLRIISGTRVKLERWVE